jgi:hypothetical protein
MTQAIGRAAPTVMSKVPSVQFINQEREGGLQSGGLIVKIGVSTNSKTAKPAPAPPRTEAPAPSPACS